MLVLSFSTPGINEWCRDTWLACWNQPLSNTRTRCPCNRVPKQSAGVFHSLDKCPGLMTPWQPCLQRVQWHSRSRQRVDRELHAAVKSRVANLCGCSISCNHFSGKSVGNFVSILAKSRIWVCLTLSLMVKITLQKKKKSKVAVCLQL